MCVRLMNTTHKKLWIQLVSYVCPIPAVDELITALRSPARSVTDPPQQQLGRPPSLDGYPGEDERRGGHGGASGSGRGCRREASARLPSAHTGRQASQGRSGTWGGVAIFFCRNVSSSRAAATLISLHGGGTLSDPRVNYSFARAMTLISRISHLRKSFGRVSCGHRLNTAAHFKASPKRARAATITPYTHPR